MSEHEILNRGTIINRLTKDIAQLRDDIAATFGDDTEKGQAAGEALDQAQEIVSRIDGQLDEAIYQVARVRAMLTRHQNFKQWSAKWGGILFGYALIWLSLLGAGFFFRDRLSMILGETNEAVNVVRAAWVTALAGGVGGVFGSLFELLRGLIKKTFYRQQVMYYAAKPIMGFLLGVVAYFIIQAGFLVFEVTLNSYVEDFAAAIASIETIIQIGVGLIVGFRQQMALEWVDKIVQRFSPTAEKLEKG